MDASLVQIWPVVLAFLLSVVWVVREMARMQTRIEVQRSQIKILFQKIDKIE
jgi:flagellar biogenesis protein FliO